MGGLARVRPRWPQAAATVLVCALPVVVLVGLAAGNTWATPAQVWEALTWEASPDRFIVTELRLPRVVGALLVGAGFGAAGAVCQSVLRNPLASPDIIGVTAGASAAVVTTVVTGALGTGIMWGATGLAAVGALVAGAAVMALAWPPDPLTGVSSARIVLVGLGVNALGLSVTSWLLFRADLPDVAVATRWLAGSLSNVSLDVLLPLALIDAVVLVVLVAQRRALALLRFDALSVRARGVAPAPRQLWLLVLAAVVAAAATATAGPVAFIAFVAPQVAMRVCRTVGPEPVSSAAMGAILLVLADVAARTVFPFVLPVGLVTAVCGAPFLLWLLTTNPK